MQASGICVMNEAEWRSRGNYSEIVDCVISRMQMEHLRKRIQEIFRETEEETVFHDKRHRKRFGSLTAGKRSGNFYSHPNYAAACALVWEKWIR